MRPWCNNNWIERAVVAGGGKAYSNNLVFVLRFDNVSRIARSACLEGCDRYNNDYYNIVCSSNAYCHSDFPVMTYYMEHSLLQR